MISMHCQVVQGVLNMLSIGISYTNAFGTDIFKWLHGLVSSDKL